MRYFNFRFIEAKGVIKVFLLICLLFVSIHLGADSYTFNTGISGISGGINNFGLGLFPLGTSWSYSNSFKLLPTLQHSAYINLGFGFSLRNNYINSYYSWKTGKPLWSIYQVDIDYTEFISGEYFNPNSYMSFLISQGFGTNRCSGSGPFMTLDFSFNSRYALALEKLESQSFIFVDSTGKEKKPFGHDSVIPAHPWLQDSRKSFNNNIGINLSFYHNKGIGYGTSDGVTGNIFAEWGPDWLLNNLTISGVTSDYWKIGASLTESLAILNVYQENGMNWFSIGFNHSNTVSYTGGKVIPEHKIPGDRFRTYIGDNLSIFFNAPQFIAGDCNMRVSLSLNNGLYFGNVVNDISNQYKAIELLSGVSGNYHLGLFGFLNFAWDFGYNFAGGIWGSNPGWWQSSEVYFYVSI